MSREEPGGLEEVGGLKEVASPEEVGDLEEPGDPEEVGSLEELGGLEDPGGHGVPSRRLGFFGGTFDPPHLGHLVAARDVVEALELDGLFFLVARVPPHKREREVVSGQLRLEMVRAAVEGDEVVGVSDLELQREGPSFSVDTLRELKERLPAADIHFVIGADQLAELDTWKEPEEVARLSHLVVMTRGGEGAREGGAAREGAAAREGKAAREETGTGEETGKGRREVSERDVSAETSAPRSPVDVPFEVVPVTRIDLSSTEIRRRIREGRSIRYLVPEPVRRIIAREGLYQ